jgi:hypothetical protein
MAKVVFDTETSIDTNIDISGNFEVEIFEPLVPGEKTSLNKIMINEPKILITMKDIFGKEVTWSFTPNKSFNFNLKPQE